MLLVITELAVNFLPINEPKNNATIVVHRGGIYNFKPKPGIELGEVSLAFFNPLKELLNCLAAVNLFLTSLFRFGKLCCKCVVPTIQVTISAFVLRLILSRGGILGNKPSSH